MNVFTMIGRALLLRCPNCGKSPMFHGLLKMHERCPVCSIQFEREPGYFTGAIALNLVTAEVGFVLVFVLWAYLTWPNPPWFWLQWGGAAAMVIAPILMWPFSRSVWLALDLWVHPAEIAELVAGETLSKV